MSSVPFLCYEYSALLQGSFRDWKDAQVWGNRQRGAERHQGDRNVIFGYGLSRVRDGALCCGAGLVA